MQRRDKENENPQTHIHPNDKPETLTKHLEKKFQNQKPKLQKQQNKKTRISS